ncbi:MAG: MBL fold metallo-hydrolase [Candidatus Micrarchaeia archaeon]
MKFTFLGGAGEVGRSGVLLETSDARLLLDYGIKIHGATEYPLLFTARLNAVIPTHAHLDHVGFLPMIFEHQAPPVLATAPTEALAGLLIKDAIKVQELRGFRVPYSPRAFRRAMESFVLMNYEKPHAISHNTIVTFHDAGHIPGAAIVEVEADGKRIVYTGDFKLGETHLHKGAKLIRDVDILVIESTYSDRDHPDRKHTEAELCAEIRDTLEDGGTALLPCFAVGRSQEVCQLLFECDPSLPVYIDGMAKEASELILAYPSFVKDYRTLRKALSNAEFVSHPKLRRRLIEEPSVIISPAGMLEGGPALGYLLRLNERSRVIFTGFSVENTNGWLLLNKGIVRVDGEDREIRNAVEYFDLSAHAGRADLLEFIEAAGPQKIFCMHGDHCDEFAAELREKGFDAVAPKIGEKFGV